MSFTISTNGKAEQCESRLRHAAGMLRRMRKEVWKPIIVTGSATAITAVSIVGAGKFIYWANYKYPNGELFYYGFADAIFSVGIIAGAAAVSWSELFGRAARDDRQSLRRSKQALKDAKNEASENGIGKKEIKRILRAV